MKRIVLIISSVVVVTGLAVGAWLYMSSRGSSGDSANEDTMSREEQRTACFADADKLRVEVRPRQDGETAAEYEEFKSVVNSNELAARASCAEL